MKQASDIKAPSQAPVERMAISQFKATCLAVLERVSRSGQPLLITKRGQPIAQVIPPPAPGTQDANGLGCMAGKIEILGDIVGPIAEDDWEVLK